MARRPTQDPRLGERIQTRRKLRGWSIRFAADRAGLSHSTWSRIERGLVSADNRFVIADIAAALECSVSELTGQPGTPPDRDAAAARAAAPAILQALIEVDLSQDPTCTPRPIDELDREAALVGELRLACDYARAARLLPPLLRETHAAIRGPDKLAALRLLARTADNTSFIIRYIGYPTEAWLAAERGRQAAEALEDPVILGLTTWSRVHAATGCGAYRRALTLAQREVEEMQRHADACAGPEMLGQLYMSCAFAAYAVGQYDDAKTWVQQAVPLAERTGDSHQLGLMFGPTNIHLWQISMEVDGGEPGHAVEIARSTNPAAAGLSVSRQVAYWSDTARALARLRRDREAVRMLLHAERLAPVRVRSSPLIQETTRTLLDRAQRRAGGSELRGLCERMNITA
jgi:transcriptional regulator with XRE-family HTH domain